MRYLVEDYKVQILDAIILALREDIGSGDITTNTVIGPEARTKAKIRAKAKGIVCGIGIAGIVFRSVDKDIKYSPKVKDGSSVGSGTVIAEISGPARGILTAERTALNFLQKLSGISTLTQKYVRAAGNKVKILDTRKTSPGLRVLEKYAVHCGGGKNHRTGLFDDILIKDNHISVAGSINKAVKAAISKYDRVEVETRNMKEVREAINSGATRIMLDNMGLTNIRNAVKMIRALNRNIEIEVSGGVDINNIRKIAGTGIDYISIGALTHSAPALDINLKIG